MWHFRSVQHHLQTYHQVWQATRSALLCSAAWNKRLADRRCTPAPTYVPGQKVWLSSKDLPLQTDYHKLAPRYIRTFEIARMIYPLVAQLKPPPALKVHLSFNVLLLKSVSFSPLSPPSDF